MSNDLQTATVSTDSVPPYKYLLTMWGEIYDHPDVCVEAGLTEESYWFDSAAERELFSGKIKRVAEDADLRIRFSLAEGHFTHLRTVATMKFVTADGKQYPFEYDFGYAYSDDAAHYMFHVGNYSCDCNKSLFIHRTNPEFPVLDCGDTIELRDFDIKHLV